jgi:UDP-N-acetylglucosamine--N-acetylmuramyl-(pentapeptide) pyrophosphoryl-undecaprenol N-acetylglucosamine transferase
MNNHSRLAMHGASSTTIIFAGGGTGGHLFPGIAVAQTLQASNAAIRCVFVGSGRELERQIVNAHGYEHRPLAIESSSVLWKNPLRFLNQTRKSIRSAAELLEELRPAVIVGLGGFASIPVAWAARPARLPIVLLEQNAVPGRATSWLSGQAEVTCLGFSEAGRFLRQGVFHVVTGNPLRSEITAAALTRGRNAARPTLLVLGGSQGSSALNDAVLSCVESAPHDFGAWHIIHQSGLRDFESVRRRYAAVGVAADVATFFEKLSEHYPTASLAVCRAGALTLSELAFAGVPAVAIPYPRAIRNHQWRNACVFEHAGGLRIVRQSRIEARTGAQLASQLSLLMSDEDTRRRMGNAMRTLARPDAAARVSAEIHRFLPEPQAALNEPDQNPEEA